jgi:60kDa lysophospholipase
MRILAPMATDGRVLILYTGGTIGMREGPRGFAPARDFLGAQLERLPQFHEPGQPRFSTPPLHDDTSSRDGAEAPAHGRRVRYDLKEYEELLDSSNMGLSDWARIAQDIADAYDDYDAFVVLHGTDTMAYTASALSFMLENLGKSVILTGSQIPLALLRNDAVDNLLGALILAGHYAIPEVCLYFRNKLLRGNRAQKVDALGFDAFGSGNYPPLVDVGTDIRVRWPLVRQAPAKRAKKLRVRTAMDPHVAALRLFPGITTDILQNFLRPPLRGLVLETYGTGNAPDRRADFLAVLAEATARGVVVVSCTQCHTGRVSYDYAAGKALAEAGVIGGADMTPEAALTKLCHLLGAGLTPAQTRRAMVKDLRGELTPR